MKLAMLISGSGTTAGSIVSAVQNGSLKGVEPVCVVASKPGIPGIERLHSMGISSEQITIMSPKSFESSEEYGEAMMTFFRKHEVDFVGQYGWLVKTPANVVAVYHDRIVNQHPSPLDPGRPDFGGKGMYGRRAVYARMQFVKRVNRDFWTEATAHRVVMDYDRGSVVRATRVEIKPDDTVASLYERLLPMEYETQIAALRDFADGTVKEIVRPVPLVRPGEEEILEACKQEAIQMYPLG